MRRPLSFILGSIDQTRGPRRRSVALRVLAVALLLSAMSVPVSAQETTQSSDVPYDQELLRLAEVMGALHALRPLCGHEDAPTWRERMISLLDVETDQGDRRRRFIERFNLGYRGFSSTYRECTPAARLSMKQYVSEGQSLIRDVTGRFSR